MQFCGEHWERLRAAISERGLDHLVAGDGVMAARQMKTALEQGRSTLANFDPLMYAHWAIVNNAMGIVGIALMTLDEHGKSRCPLCYLNEQHHLYCSDPDCTIERDSGYDVWVDRAADDAKAEADRLLAEEAV